MSHDQRFRGFVAFDDQLSIGIYAEGGGTYGEFIVEWHDLDLRGRSSPIPRVCLFSDAWHLLSHPGFSKLWAYLASRAGEDMSRERLCDALLGLGFIDKDKL